MHYHLLGKGKGYKHMHDELTRLWNDHCYHEQKRIQKLENEVHFKRIRFSLYLKEEYHV
jgi:hypothetical protein